MNYDVFWCFWGRKKLFTIKILVGCFLEKNYLCIKFDNFDMNNGKQRLYFLS